MTICHHDPFLSNSVMLSSRGLISGHVYFIVVTSACRRFIYAVDGPSAAADCRHGDATDWQAHFVRHPPFVTYRPFVAAANGTGNGYVSRRQNAVIQNGVICHIEKCRQRSSFADGQTCTLSGIVVAWQTAKGIFISRLGAPLGNEETSHTFHVTAFIH